MSTESDLVNQSPLDPSTPSDAAKYSSDASPSGEGLPADAAIKSVAGQEDTKVIVAGYYCVCGDHRERIVKADSEEQAVQYFETKLAPCKALIVEPLTYHPIGLSVLQMKDGELVSETYIP